MDEPCKVVIAHSDPVITRALELACTGRGFEVMATTEAPESVIGQAEGCGPGVLVWGEALGPLPMGAALDRLDRSGMRVIVLVSDCSPARVAALLQPPVCGLFSSDSALSHVTCGVAAVAKGLIVLDRTVAGALNDAWHTDGAGSASARGSLTPREYDVLTAMAAGLATKAIAIRLGMASKTVENHKIRVFQKLGARNQAHAVTIALAGGVLPSADSTGEVDES